MESRKKKIFFHSDFSLAKTGFGRNTKAILSYLYKTGKYDIVNYCCHIQDGVVDLQKTPWKSIGCVPSNDSALNRYLASVKPHEKDEATRAVWYGAFNIDSVIENEKPDVYFGVQDIWGVNYSIDKPWFNKITSVIWTTLDSLPLFPPALDKAKSIKNYWMWSSFATDEMHRLGHKHVQTFHGAIDTSFFKPLSKEKKVELRISNKIEKDRFMIGFVFRNQLRKSVDNLMKGYALWKKSRPELKSGLLLHTCFSEGWNIPSLAEENQIPKEEIYTTYICRNCRNYKVVPFSGEGIDCNKCGESKSSFTTNLGFGVSESELNEVYNLMDVYCHPFTSGGQEIPIQEAKLAGLTTLVTNYSCGQEMCKPEAFSLPLEWEQYREFGTQFIKATTLKESIAKQLEFFYLMPESKKEEWSIEARKWALENYSIEYLGKKMEEFLDSCPFVDWTVPFISDKDKKNPEAAIPSIQNDVEYIKSLYKLILNMEVSDSDGGLNHWMSQLAKGIPRNQIENFFRHTAVEENKKLESSAQKPQTLESILDKDDDGRRILVAIPDGIGDGFLITSLFKSLKEQYPNHNLYVATTEKIHSVFVGNEYIHRIINYIPEMDNLLLMEGFGNHKGYFDIAFIPYATTQRFLTYVHNGKTNIAYKDLKY